MIEFKNVTKFRIEHGRKRFIMKNASFVIPDRSRVVILTTEPGDSIVLIKMISGILPADEGKIATTSKISWMVGESIGMVNSLSARQNIKLVCGINGLGRSKSNKIVDMVAKFTGLGTHVDDPISTYRPGMKARLAFALSLAMKFDYYLVSGKVSVGSGEFKKRSFATFSKVVGRSGMILGVPNIKLARMLCNSALVVTGGEATFYNDIEKGIASFRTLQPEVRAKRRPRRLSAAAETTPDPELPK